jgi:hypothetical protein
MVSGFIPQNCAANLGNFCQSTMVFVRCLFAAAQLGRLLRRNFIALRAELYFDRRVIFTISLREIVKMTRLSEEYSAAVGGKNLFTQPQIK